MKTLHTQAVNQPAVLAAKLFKFERCGKYEEAFEELADIWPDTNISPRIDGFEAHISAEILLRCGSLIGYFGHNSQIPDAQLRSKDLLSNARERFLKLGEIEKTAECESHLALTYWRTGEYNESEDWVREAMGHDLAKSSDTRLHAIVAKTLIDISRKRYEDVVKTGDLLESDFRTNADAFLTGSFYTNLALSHKNIGDLPRALGYYELARYYHQRSRHKIYLGTVENNLAHLYLVSGRFSKAHESIDNATRIFKYIKDKTREGYSLDTKALVYFTEAKYDEALQTVEKAVAILNATENSAYKAETLLTKAKVLLYLDNFSGAVLALFDAVEIAKLHIGKETVIRLINEFESALNERNAPSPVENLEAADLELILPTSIAHFQDYRGIWINNTRLEKIGLTRGSLAIVANEKINRGDLVAISENENSEVSCGFYDTDFGIVCLDGSVGEPQVFDEKDVTILGKIVGVCDSGRNEEGKMVVRSLNL